MKFSLKDNLLELSQLEYFKSDNERFLNIKRTKNLKKTHKEKDPFGFVTIKPLGIGVSLADIVIKKILESSENFSTKYDLMRIDKYFTHSDQLYDELLRAELMQYIDPNQYSKTRKSGNSLTIKIDPNFTHYNRNYAKNSDAAITKFILLTYIIKIEDRGINNISSDLKNIDFAKAKIHVENSFTNLIKN